MAKHTTKEAYFERLRNLADVNKTSIKESKTRNLGSLIDYKRAPDGVAYGIIKENHLYFLKKAGTKQDPNVADFAYIGGLGNVTNFQYKSLAEADKQRNMLFHTINEVNTLKPNKSGSKMVITEDVAGREIDQAAEKIGDLDAATSAEEVPAEPPAPEGDAEMTAGLSAEPPAPESEVAPEGGEELPAEPIAPEGDGDVAPDTGEVAPEGDGEVAPEGDGEVAPEGDDTEVPADGEVTPDGEKTDEPNAEIEKVIGKLTNRIRKTEMEDAQVKSYINSFLSAFKDKLRDIEIEDRKEMANKLLKVVGPEEIEDLGDAVPQDKPEGLDAEIEEDQCAECGGFGKYAESRGYDSPEKFKECDDEEQANVISGYANAHGEGQNDGDFKTIAILITPEILEKLKGDYGHEDYAEKLTPYTDSLNETSEEDKLAQLNELWGGLGALGKAAGRGIAGAGKAIGGAAKSAGQAIGGAVKGAGQAVAGGAQKAWDATKQAGANIKQAYNTGEINPEVKKLEGVAADLGKQIAALNKRMVGAGQQPVNVKSILATIQNQLGGAAGAADLSKYKVAAESVDPANTEVSVPNMLKETDKKVAPGNKVVSEPNMLKEEDEEAEETEKDFDVDDIETDDAGTGKIEGGEISTDELGGGEVEDTKDGIGFAPDSQSLGVATVKPDGAPTTGVDITIDPDKTVNISMNEAKRKLIKQIAESVNVYMNDILPIKKLQPVKSLPPTMSESEVKLRKYVRTRLEEKAGLKKPSLNESKKSSTLKKLDKVIDEQFKLYEGVILKKKVK
jgi:hypothetical protein